MTAWTPSGPGKGSFRGQMPAQSLSGHKWGCFVAETPSAPGWVCRPVPTTSLSTAGNSEPSGRARYSGREINSSLPRPDELPSKKIFSDSSWSPQKSGSCWTGNIFFGSASSLPPVPQLHLRPKRHSVSSWRECQLSRIATTPSEGISRGSAPNPWHDFLPRICPGCPTGLYRAWSANP